MTTEPQNDPFAGLAQDLADLKRDCFGIHAAALEVVAVFDRAERRARRRLIITIIAASLFAATAARVVAVTLGQSFAGALATAFLVGTATAMSALVVLPWPAILRRLRDTLRTEGWRR